MPAILAPGVKYHCLAVHSYDSDVNDDFITEDFKMNWLNGIEVEPIEKMKQQ